MSARKTASPSSDTTLQNSPAASPPSSSVRNTLPDYAAPTSASAAHNRQSPSSSAVVTPDRLSRDPAPHLSQRPVPAAPGRQEPYHRHSSSRSGVANPQPVRPPVTGSPLADRLHRQAAMDSSSLSSVGAPAPVSAPSAPVLEALLEENESGPERSGNDSSDTVVPARPVVPLPAFTPGQIALDSLRRQYASNAQPVDLGEDGLTGETEGADGGNEWSETIRNLVTRVGQFVPMNSYYEFIGSRCVFNLGVVGQFESALNQLSFTAEQAYAQLNVPAGRRVLAPQWQDPLLVVANSDFAHAGEASRAFKYLAAWVRHAQSHVEVLLGLRSEDEYVAPPRALNLALRGHFNTFAETTMRGLQDEMQRAGSPAPSAADAGRAPWSAKDTVRLAKIINTPAKPRDAATPIATEQDLVYSFAGELAARDGKRRKSHAVQPLDFTNEDPLAGIASSLFKIQRPVAKPSGEPLPLSLARARAQPAQLVHAHSMTAFLDPDASADASHASVTVMPPQQGYAQAATYKLTPPAPDDSDEGSDSGRGGPARPPPGGGGQGGNPYGDPDGNGGPGGGNGGGHGGNGGGGGHGGNGGNGGGAPGGNGGGHGGGGGGDGGGGGEPGGEPPYNFPTYGQFRQSPGLVLDMRIKIDSLPTWDGNDKTALKYFSQLNEWARAGKTSELIHQLPHIAPLRFTGAVNTWWSNLSAQTRAELQQSYRAFIPGIRRLFLSDRWAEDRRSEFVAMKFRQKYHEHESPFDYVNRRILLARVLYDLSPEQLVTEVLANSPPQWAYILGEHSIRNTDELMTRVRQIGPSLISAYNAAGGAAA